MRSTAQIVDAVTDGLKVQDIKGRVDDVARTVTVSGPPGYRELYWPVRGTDAMTSSSLGQASHAKCQYERAEMIAQIVLADIITDQGVNLDAFAGEGLYIDPGRTHRGGKAGAVQILRNTLDM